MSVSPAILIALFSLLVSFASSLFALSQLKIAREAQLTPFRVSIYNAKIESYKIITTTSRHIVDSSQINEELRSNLDGFKEGLADSLERGSEERRYKEELLDIIDKQSSSAKLIFERDLPLLAEHSFVWTGNVGLLINKFRSTAERDKICYTRIGQLIHADPDDHDQPFDEMSWDWDDDNACSSLANDASFLTVWASQMDEAMRNDLRADQLQIIPTLRR